MIKKFSFFLVILMTLNCQALKLNQVIDILKEVESDYRYDVRGDQNRAVGILQIHKITVDEANRILKLRNSDKRFNYDDRKSKYESELMAKIIFSFYSERLNKLIDYMAFWCMGPDFNLNKYTKTIHYRRFIKVMKNLKTN